jgi:hypothetical protein
MLRISRPTPPLPYTLWHEYATIFIFQFLCIIFLVYVSVLLQHRWDEGVLQHGTQSCQQYSSSSSITVPAANTPDVLQPEGLLYYPMLWKFPLAPPGTPTSTPMWETSSCEGRNRGREMTGNFANNGNFHAIVRIFYMPQICDMGPTALLPSRRKACWGIFFALKNPMASAGFEPANLGTRGQHATSRPLVPNSTLYKDHHVPWNVNSDMEITEGMQCWT